jgi:hypothetical protein
MAGSSGTYVENQVVTVCNHYQQYQFMADMQGRYNDNFRMLLLCCPSPALLHRWHSSVTLLSHLKQHGSRYSHCCAFHYKGWRETGNHVLFWAQNLHNDPVFLSPTQAYARGCRDSATPNSPMRCMTSDNKCVGFLYPVPT